MRMVEGGALLVELAHCRQSMLLALNSIRFHLLRRYKYEMSPGGGYKIRVGLLSVKDIPFWLGTGAGPRP